MCTTHTAERERVVGNPYILAGKRPRTDLKHFQRLWHSPKVVFQSRPQSAASDSAWAGVTALRKESDAGGESNNLYVLQQLPPITYN
jgi:hypothetical protein